MKSTIELLPEGSGLRGLAATLASADDATARAAVAPVIAGYGAADDEPRCAILACCGDAATRAGAEALIGCVRAHGWPSSVYERVFWELPKLAPHAAVLYPELLLAASDSQGLFVRVGDAMLHALGTGALAPSALAPIAEALAGAVEANLADAEAAQVDDSVGWRHAEDYQDVRAINGFLLDLAGWLPPPLAGDVLERALALADPWLVTFAAVARLRRGEEVGDHVLARVAACDETRAPLFDRLAGVGRLDRFPAAERTLARFAAADMASWLAHPSELGRTPDHLELMAELRHPDVASAVLFVWRFRNEDDDRGWRAGVSGPYPTDADGPVQGASTFSRFEAWDAHPPEGHAAAVLATLVAWDAARRER